MTTFRLSKLRQQPSKDLTRAEFQRALRKYIGRGIPFTDEHAATIYWRLIEEGHIEGPSQLDIPTTVIVQLVLGTEEGWVEIVGDPPPQLLDKIVPEVQWRDGQLPYWLCGGCRSTVLLSKGFYRCRRCGRTWRLLADERWLSIQGPRPKDQWFPRPPPTVLEMLMEEDE